MFNQFTKEELDAIQWDTLEEDLLHCSDYDINPDYDAMDTLYNAAKREA